MKRTLKTKKDFRLLVEGLEMTGYSVETDLEDPVRKFNYFDSLMTSNDGEFIERLLICIYDSLEEDKE